MPEGSRWRTLCFRQNCALLECRPPGRMWHGWGCAVHCGVCALGRTDPTKCLDTRSVVAVHFCLEGGGGGLPTGPEV